MRDSTSPASRNTRRCFDTAGWLTGERLDEVTDRALALEQEIEDAPAIRFGDHVEEGKVEGRSHDPYITL